MAKISAALVLVAALVLGVRGVGVWVSCGYDCPALPYVPVTATLALIAAVALAVLGCGLAVGAWLVRTSDRG